MNETEWFKVVEVVPSNNLETENKNNEIIIYLVLGKCLLLTFMKSNINKNLLVISWNFFRMIPSLRVLVSRMCQFFCFQSLSMSPPKASHVMLHYE
jgi:hypothetical protein